MRIVPLNLGKKSESQVAALLPELESLVARVGEQIMLFFKAPTEIAHKSDGSPVTQADHAAEEMIIQALRRLTPNIPIVAEEAYTLNHASPTTTADVAEGRFWLVDALDGTRDFLSHSEDFTVNIALIENCEPVLGIIHHPPSRTTYSGTMEGGATKIHADGRREEISASWTDAGLRIVSSKSYGNEIQLAKYLAGRQILEHRHRSSSIKFCEVAEGTADLYPRFGPSREWDTAAGHAIVVAAGGTVTTSAGQPLLYGKSDFLNSDFVARGRR